MRLSTLIELRRHFRAIDVALKQEIEAEKKPAQLARTINEMLETPVGKRLQEQTRQVEGSTKC